MSLRHFGETVVPHEFLHVCSGREAREGPTGYHASDAVLKVHQELLLGVLETRRRQAALRVPWSTGDVVVHFLVLRPARLKSEFMEPKKQKYLKEEADPWVVQHLDVSTGPFSIGTNSCEAAFIVVLSINVPTDKRVSRSFTTARCGCNYHK